MERNHAFSMGSVGSFLLELSCSCPRRLDPASCSSALVATFHIQQCWMPSTQPAGWGHPLLCPWLLTKTSMDPMLQLKIRNCTSVCVGCLVCVDVLDHLTLLCCSPTVPGRQQFIRRSIDFNRHLLNTCSGQRILLVKIRNTRIKPKEGDWGLEVRGILQEHVSSLDLNANLCVCFLCALFLGKTPQFASEFQNLYLTPERLTTKDLVAPGIDQLVILHSLCLCVSQNHRQLPNTCVGPSVFIGQLLDHGDSSFVDF